MDRVVNADVLADLLDKLWGELTPSLLREGVHWPGEFRLDEERILLTDLPQCNDTTCVVFFGISRISDHFAIEYIVILFKEIMTISRLTLQEACISRIHDQYPAHHLAYNDLNVLVIDRYTL